MKELGLIIFGAVMGFILLKIISKKPVDDTLTKKNLIEVAKTPETKLLIKSTEFSNLIRTDQFKKFARDFGSMKLIHILTI